MAVSDRSRKEGVVATGTGPGSILRSFLIGLLAAATVLGLALFTSVRWTEKQILTTDNWLAFVSPLPKDPEVNQALSTFIAGKVFDNGEVQARVTEALPPRAGFLATPLTEQLQTITMRTTQRVIGSDGFQTIWTAANRAAHERMLERARNTDQTEGQSNERFQLDLSSVGPVLRQALGRAAEALPERSEQLTVNTDLQARRDKLGQYIRTLDFLQDVMPFLLVASGAGALALAHDRRRVLLISSVLVFVLSLLQLIGVKALRPAILDKIEDSQYRPAIGGLYDSLLASFNSMVYVTLVLATLVWLAMVLAGPGSLGSRLRRFIHMNEIQETQPYHLWRKLRLWIADQKLYLWAVVAILALFYLAFVAEIDWRIMLNTIFATLGGIAILQILASPSYLIQRKP